MEPTDNGSVIFWTTKIWSKAWHGERSKCECMQKC